MPLPLVSILIPTYNRSEVFPAVVEGLLAQGYAEWEVVVVDDGSAPDQREALAREAARDPRIRFLDREGERRGAPVCRNQAFAASRGEFILFHDSDDAMAPECLEQRVAVLRARPELDFAVFQCELFRTTPGDTPLWLNVHAGDDDLLRLLRHDDPWFTASPLYRRTALERIGPWDEALASWQDWELHIRALMAGLKYERRNEGLCYMRLADPARESIGNRTMSAEHLRAQEKLVVDLSRRLAKWERARWLHRRALGGLHLFLADRWRRAGEPEEAANVWRRGRERRLYGWVSWLLGMAWLGLVPDGLPSRVVRRGLRHLDPTLFFPIPSPTFMKTPRGTAER